MADDAELKRIARYGPWPYRDAWLRWFLRLIALAYAVGALAHLSHMVGGENWRDAPAQWQALDVIYLGLDLAVVVGVLARRAFGWIAFTAAALGQVLLYTVLRDWMLDVPPEFAREAGESHHFSVLVGLHFAALGAFILLAAWRGWVARRASP